MLSDNENRGVVSVTTLLSVLLVVSVVTCLFMAFKIQSMSKRITELEQLYNAATAVNAREDDAVGVDDVFTSPASGEQRSFAEQCAAIVGSQAAWNTDTRTCTDLLGNTDEFADWCIENNGLLADEVQQKCTLD